MKTICLATLVSALVLVSLPADAAPPEPVVGEPQVHDASGDASRGPAGPLELVAAENVPGADLVSAGLTVPDSRSYVVQTTTSGPSDAAFRTAVRGTFHPPSDTIRDCEVIWFLPVGGHAYANVFCHRLDGTRWFAQTLRGGPVHAATTEAGSRLAAEFSSNGGQLGWLAQDPSVDALGAVSCGSEPGGCDEAADVYDRASSTATVDVTGGRRTR